MFIKERKLLNAQELKEKIILTSQTQKIIENNLNELKNIISGKSDKFLIIIGPCSVTDEKSICNYAQKLLKIYDAMRQKIFIVLRVFTVKSRTNLNSYKGLVHQPNLFETENLYNGIIMHRKIILKIIELTGFAIANEFVYPQIFNYADDLISYYTLGARTCDSQMHKLFLSGTDVPVGVKNSQAGNLFENISSIQNSHKLFLDGYETKTTGNIFAHAILRGTNFNLNNAALSEITNLNTNYHYENLIETIKKYPPLENKFIIVDTNHSNSNKNSFEQPRIAKEILFNRKQNDLIKKYVRGLMIESFLESGRQNENGMVFGKSITDPCLGIYETEKLLNYIAQHL
jgi:phospho-2-dehydro-3-deoxyheptonate aldolase